MRTQKRHVDASAIIYIIIEEQISDFKRRKAELATSALPTCAATFDKPNVLYIEFIVKTALKRVLTWFTYILSQIICTNVVAQEMRQFVSG